MLEFIELANKANPCVEQADAAGNGEVPSAKAVANIDSSGSSAPVSSQRPNRPTAARIGCVLQVESERESLLSSQGDAGRWHSDHSRDWPQSGRVPEGAKGAHRRYQI